jgi:predicted small lipoprotein YifL
MKNLFILLVMVCLLTACGRKGPLVPPEALVPAPVSDLKVEQRGELLRLSWTAPDKEEGGGRLRDLAGFRLYKRELLPPGEDCDVCPSAFRLVTTIDLAYPREVQRSGDRYLWEDVELQRGKTFRYYVVPYKKDGSQGRESTRISRKVVAPPAPPVLQGLPLPEGIRLELAPAAGASTDGSFRGYQLFRKTGSDKARYAPLTNQPVLTGTYIDQGTMPGTTYLYRASMLLQIDGQLVESPVSGEISVTATPID